MRVPESFGGAKGLVPCVTSKSMSICIAASSSSMCDCAGGTSTLGRLLTEPTFGHQMVLP